MKPQASPFDRGNPLLAPCACQMSVTVLQTPDGQQLALTLRSASTTMTVLLSSADAKAWAAQIEQAVSQISGLIIPRATL